MASVFLFKPSFVLKLNVDSDKASLALYGYDILIVVQSSIKFNIGSIL